MGQREIIREIREYHIIRNIISADSVKRLIDQKDPKVAGILAVYGSFVQDFGQMRIDQFEDFNRYFRRLENNYLADPSHRKYQPTEAGYSEYIKLVLGERGLKTLSEVFNKEENARMMRDMHISVGRDVQETNAVVVANHIRDYSVVAGLRGNLTESRRKASDLEVELDKVRAILKVTKENASTKEQVVAKLDETQTAILNTMLASFAGNEYLMRSIAKSTGRKIEEVEEMVMNASHASRIRDERILDRLDGGFADLSGKVDRVSDKVDVITNQMQAKSRGKVIAAAGLGVLGGAAVTTIVALLLSNNQPVQQPTNVEGINPSEYDAYVSEVYNLQNGLKELLVDNVLTEEEKTNFLASIQEFASKYNTGAFATSSKNQSEHLTNMADVLFNMSEDKIEAAKSIVELELNILGIQEQLTNYKTENQQLADKNTALQAEIDSHVAKIAELEAQVADLVSKLEAANSGSAIQALNVKIAALETQIADLNGQVETLTGEKTTLQGTVDTLTAENATLKANVSELQTSNEELSSQLSEANASLATAQGQVATLEAEKAELVKQVEAGALTQKQYEEKIKALEAKEKELSGKVDELVAQVGSLNSELATAKENYNKLKAQYDALNTSNQAVAAELAAAQEKIVELENKINTTTVEAAELIFNIYEYITGSTTTDLEVAMAVVSDELGLSEITPSENTRPTGPQPN